METRTADPPRARTTCFHHHGHHDHYRPGVIHPTGKSEQCRRDAVSPSAHISTAPQRTRYSCVTPARDRGLTETLRLLRRSSERLAKRLVFGKSMVLVLAIVLNAALTGGSAMHRVRHDHFRRDLPGTPFPRCDAPGPSSEREVAASVGGWCSRHRQRRAAQWSLELRETVGKTLCPFTVCEDRDENRRPQSIHKVVCLEAGCRCTEEGSYRCVQVVDEMEVLYLDDRADDAWLSKRIKVEVGCVCAANVAQTGSTSFPNAIDQ